jgi:hypothetical protein
MRRNKGEGELLLGLGSSWSFSGNGWLCHTQNLREKLGGNWGDFAGFQQNPENPGKFWVRIVKDWRRKMNASSFLILKVHLKPNIMRIVLWFLCKAVELQCGPRSCVSRWTYFVGLQMSKKHKKNKRSPIYFKDKRKRIRENAIGDDYSSPARLSEEIDENFDEDVHDAKSVFFFHLR